MVCGGVETSQEGCDGMVCGGVEVCQEGCDGVVCEMYWGCKELVETYGICNGIYGRGKGDAGSCREIQGTCSVTPFCNVAEAQSGFWLVRLHPNPPFPLKGRWLRAK